MSSPKNNKDGKGSSLTSTTYEFQSPQEQTTVWEYIFNPKKGTVLGRDGANWSKLLLFYIIFYAVLAGLFAISMQGLFATLDDREPKWKLERSLIGTNPGLGFRPLPKETQRGSIIDFNSTKPETQQYWINLLDEYLKPYHNKTMLPNEGRNQFLCSDNKIPKGQDNVCAVDLDSTNDCGRNNSYGYKNNKPCIFLKLNKIFNWVPDYYEANELPKEMPDDLITYIKALPVNERKQIWVSCKGHQEHDEEKIHAFNYPKSRGFASYYYPYTNAIGYLSPLVPVQVVLKGFNQIINIECRAWAKNIVYSGSLRDRMGSVTFQIMIDN